MNKYKVLITFNDTLKSYHTNETVLRDYLEWSLVLPEDQITISKESDGRSSVTIDTDKSIEDVKLKIDNYSFKTGYSIESVKDNDAEFKGDPVNDESPENKVDTPEETVTTLDDSVVDKVSESVSKDDSISFKIGDKVKFSDIQYADIGLVTDIIDPQVLKVRWNDSDEDDFVMTDEVDLIDDNDKKMLAAGGSV